MNRLGIYIDAWDKDTHTIDVYGNSVSNCTSDGFVVVSEAGGLLHDIRIFNNIAYSNDGSGIVVAAWGEPGYAHPVQDVLIVNNTFYGNGSAGWGCGISVENPEADNIELINNICSGNISQISTEAYGSGLVVEYNLINGYTDEYGTNYVEGDPDFVSASAGNFHLTSDSPAIDAGTSTNAPAVDFDGTSRPQGSGYDIGAFEYH